ADGQLLLAVGALELDRHGRRRPETVVLFARCGDDCSTRPARDATGEGARIVFVPAPLMDVGGERGPSRAPLVRGSAPLRMVRCGNRTPRLPERSWPGNNPRPPRR